MFKNLTVFAFLLFCSVNLSAQTAGAPLMIGRAASNQNKIALTYAGKIWLADRNGGTAKLLTNTPNEETNPVFSPDGKWLAFSRSNGGDYDIYVISADGAGQARRVTMMPEGDFMVAWTPDGKEVVFETTRDEEGVSRLYKIAVENPTLAEALPLPQAFDGSFSPDGKFIAYNPRTFIFGEWRYYRGGMTAPIWIANLQTGALEKLPNQNFNDRNPMWVNDKIYFVSDRTGGTFNLFVQDRKTKQTQQITKFSGQGIRAASANGNTISFVQDGRIHLFDTGTNQDKIVNVSVSPDTSEIRPRAVNAMRFLEQVLPSADGEKLSFGARGEVLLFDTGNGEAKNLTNTSGVAERYPTISPDGKTVAYFSDETGEYFLHVRSLQDNSVKKISIEKQPSFYWNLIWSPDSKKLAFNDRNLNLWLADAQSGTTARVDKSDYSAQDNFSPNFSPDSRFLTYSKRLKNRAGAVFIYDLAQRKPFQITDGKTHTESPVFDNNGKYLYFVSSPNAGTSEFSWGVLNGTMARPLVIRRVHALILSKDTQSPTLPNGQPNPDAKVSDSASQVKIDFENFSNRFVNLPLPQRDYSRLMPGKAGKLFLGVGEWSKTPGDYNAQGETTAVYYLDLSKMGEMQKIIEDVGSFDLTQDGSKLLYQKGRDWFLVKSEAAAKADEGKLNLSKMEISVNPSEEWRQIFHESMRIMRDWFYDPNYHGQNLNALENYYAAYLPTITRRADLNTLIGRMLGSVSVSHFGIGGGDAPQVGGGNNIGLLGADYAIDNGKYRFKKIYRGTSYASPAGSFTAPLDRAGVDVHEGDYLLEVDGNKVEADKNILGYFEKTAGKPTKIMVSTNPNGSGARTYTVYPSNGENRLRRANWAENNRKTVEKLSGGKLGYIFIEGFGPDGIMNAISGLTGNSDKAGVIIDQRFNGGGITPDYLIEWLKRKPLYYYMFRGGSDIATPVNPATPVNVLITNEHNGSAAETFAFMYKLGKVGPIVGKGTAGAGIGPYFFTPRFVDGGRVQLPNRAAYNPDGSSWGIENGGVPPDFDVELTPQDLMAGKDSQLIKAVEVAMAQTAKNPVIQPKRPVFPVHPGNDASKNLSFTPQISSLALPGSAFPVSDKMKVEIAPVTNGKFAAYLGQFDTPMGVVSFKQEGDKLIGDASGDRIELFPDSATKDKFAAQTASVNITFERDASGKVAGITLIMPNGREIKGKRIQ